MTESSGDPRKAIVIGVAGGSGSGKTTVVRRIVESLGDDQVTVLEQDRYYRDRNDLRLEERAALNYDHPDSLETDLLVALTRVASRYVVILAAAILVLLGLVAKFGAVVATIPPPIVGGLYCTLFGLIAAIGLQTAARADLNSNRNLMIMGFILFMGLSVPAFFGGVESLGFPPHQVTVGPDWFRSMLETIGQTGMAVAAILGILLDNIIPGTPEERGLTGPVTQAPTEVSDLPS